MTTTNNNQTLKANNLKFGFFGACWSVFESSGEWVKTPEGEYWQAAENDWLDPETNDNREYARIHRNGEIIQGKWWGILTDEQKAQITDFAEYVNNKTINP